MDEQFKRKMSKRIKNKNNNKNNNNTSKNDCFSSSGEGSSGHQKQIKLNPAPTENKKRDNILDYLINAPSSSLHRSQIQITRSHLFNNPLYSGSKFKGCQKSRGHSYDVEVTFKVKFDSDPIQINFIIFKIFFYRMLIWKIRMLVAICSSKV